MYKVDKTSKKLQKVEETTFTALGFKERQDIQEWIVANPEILGEELLIIAKEFDGFADTSERLDLLALDLEGNLVVIENKRDNSGTGVEWQAIKYASYCSTLKRQDVLDIFKDYLNKQGITDNPEDIIDDFYDNNANIVYPTDNQRIILVSHVFRKEVLSAAQWLLNQQIDIKCVSIKPYLSGGEIYLDTDVILPQEENKEYTLKIADKQRDSAREKWKASDTGKMYQEFWKLFEDNFPNKDKTSLKDRDFSKNFEGWLGGSANMSSPRTSFNLCAYKKGVRVELYIDANKGKALNKDIFDYLFTQKASVDTKFGSDVLKWDRLDGKLSCRISLENNDLSFQNKDDWDAIFKFFNDKIVIFEEAFKPYAKHVRDMVASYAPEE